MTEQVLGPAGTTDRCDFVTSHRTGLATGWFQSGDYLAFSHQPPASTSLLLQQPQVLFTEGGCYQDNRMWTLFHTIILYFPLPSPPLAS